MKLILKKKFVIKKLQKIKKKALLLNKNILVPYIKSK